jgi:hypothetical protein
LLADNMIGATGAIALADKLPEMASLTTLDLAGVAISVAFSALAWAQRLGPEWSTRRLDCVDLRKRDRSRGRNCTGEHTGADDEASDAQSSLYGHACTLSWLFFMSSVARMSLCCHVSVLVCGCGTVRAHTWMVWRRCWLLAGNMIGATGARKLADAFTHLASLTTLNLASTADRAPLAAFA